MRREDAERKPVAGTIMPPGLMCASASIPRMASRIISAYETSSPSRSRTPRISSISFALASIVTTATKVRMRSYSRMLLL